ncbi:MAG: metal ABC transporter substrate-binding protein, partial [Leptolyngbya sp. SIO4C1]|nr:metal ABC transporter substrate-binding protein [Leptolyngbya sp. SIO4C1]
MNTQRCIELSRLQALSLALLAGLSLGGCELADTEATTNVERPQVVATSTILADLTQAVGGDNIEVVSILQPGDDPHIYEPVPRDTIAIEQADLIFYNGFNLEPELIRLISGTGSDSPKVAVGEVAEPLSFQYQGQTQPDPHVWGDVENAIAMVAAIRNSLIELDPESAADYTANAAQLTAQLIELDAWIEQQIATIPPEQRRLVTTHDAFQYYTEAYGLEVLGTLIGISTEEQPSAQTVQRLVESIKAAGVPAIFAETTINPQLIRTVAEEAGVRLAEQELYSDSIGASGSPGDSYVDMQVSNT